MDSPGVCKLIRDPLWNTIRLDGIAVRIIDTAEFQRLRYIRQLGLAHLVYPGATHTRFDHALGVYHLTVTALRRLRDRGGVPEERFFASPALRSALAPLGADAPDRILELIRGRSSFPLRGLVSGSLDLDKMEYLRRDARFCGVPYGEVDVDRLLQGLVLVPDPVTGDAEVGVQEKAVAALESLLFAKYQMFRNVYWHHAVRAATALYKRIVEDAVDAGILQSEELIGPTDEELLHEISRRSAEQDSEVAERLATRWLPALRHRRLPKRALELTAADLHGRVVEDWVAEDSPRRRQVEDQLAGEVDLEPGEVVVDFPAKRAMFQLDILVERRDGTVERLGSEGLPGLVDLPRVARALYTSSRVLRVFTFERRTLDPSRVIDLVTRAPTPDRPV
jgi:HD superfamily phosphohydrolase